MAGATRLLLILSSPLPVLRHTCRGHHRLCPKLHSPRIYLSNHYRRRLHVARWLSPRSKTLLSLPPSRQFHAQSSSSAVTDYNNNSYPESHPCPAWFDFVNNLSSLGYLAQLSSEAIRGSVEDEFVAVSDIPDDFLRVATACLAFARDRPFILGSLPAKDISTLVEHGSAFLFRNGQDSIRKLQTYLTRGNCTELDTNGAQTVDLMKVLLSYVSQPFLSHEKQFKREVVIQPVENLLNELTRQSHSVPQSNFQVPVQNQFPERYAQSPRHFGNNIEMKRGDWICPRCSFMNFARNMKCLECEEARPTRQLTGGEWECPQCNFFNYGRNTVCLRCDCKRPGELSSNTNFAAGFGYNDSGKTGNTDIERRLAANEEKAQRWFSKISQLDGTSDISSAIEDEDFPEIMPLRKGVNRFVVSTRKTPLERRLANAQYRRNMSNDGGNQESKISRSLDDLLGGTPNNSQSITTDGLATGPTSSSFVDFNGSTSTKNNLGAPDSFLVNRKLENDGKDMATESIESSLLRESPLVLEKSVKKIDDKDMDGKQNEKSEGWLAKIAEVHGVKNIHGETFDSENPESMPIRKGDNKFVVSKQKDRSLTSPLYKRRMAMEQNGNENFVPFVPFPPDYFARKDNQQPSGTDCNNQANDEKSKLSVPEKPLDNFNDAPPEINKGSRPQYMQNQHSLGVANCGPSEVIYKDYGTDLSYDAPETRTSSQNFSHQSNNFSQWNGEPPLENPNERRHLAGNSSIAFEDQNMQGEWRGKSLEGSAVKEPDPLDMSEEAKAERWFRRVAQIKDISELSQIPDEDFSSIMPMRKGVNRFVVSKRKTPLERRLTSSQYRRNLPIVSPDPIKKEGENS